ncbi:MAG: hypothetical protein GTO53_12225 [Planctomycetales bacterium]|nr:hypothetical protein [Planctomycetales bacterium]NIM09874.1 hypothetical protein [Planctomycetales bacterium]NIN09312.1 hypothetical protein [Planctomycetales bacterium]NIN78420.1 hypothetical protein [Planctomycetales bacterium]NIO35596.1 hypothetical protein [Planctomycetales bacterium]
MSDDYLNDYDAEDAEHDEIEEEISTEEVDRVLETLSDLMQNVESETVHEHLEEAYNGIFALVYEEEEETSEVADEYDEEDEEDADLEDELEGFQEIDDEDDQAEAA